MHNYALQHTTRSHGNPLQIELENQSQSHEKPV